MRILRSLAHIRNNFSQPLPVKIPSRPRTQYTEMCVHGIPQFLNASPELRPLGGEVSLSFPVPPLGPFASFPVPPSGPFREFRRIFFDELGCAPQLVVRVSGEKLMK